MSMAASSMAGKIVDNMKAVNADIDAAQEAFLLSYWTPICQGIIDELVNAVVQAGSFTTSAGPVTGTGGGIS